MHPTLTEPRTFLVNGFGAVHGGIVRVHNEICAELASRGDVIVVAAPAEQVRAPHITMLTRQEPSRARSLIRELWNSRHPVNVDFHIDSAPAFRARVTSRQRIVFVHDLNFLKPQIHNISWKQWVYRRFLHRWTLRRADAVFVNSTQTRDEVIRFLPATADKIDILPLPVSEFARSQMKSNSRLPELAELRLIAFGHAANKGIDRLVKALVRRPGWTLTVIAPLATWNRLWNPIATSAGVRDRIRVLEDVHDVDLADHYRNADVFCMLSTYEGYGLPVAEAIALGVPTVTSDLAVLRETARGYARVPVGSDVGSDIQAIEAAAKMETRALAEAAASVRMWTWSTWVDRLIMEAS